MRKFIHIIIFGWALLLPSQIFSLETKHETSFVVFPVDCNANPPMLFGGKVLSEMDRCAAIAARRLLYGSPATGDYVTVGVNNVKFIKSGQVKDLIYVKAEVVKLGEKSITINVVVERETKDLKRETLATAEYVFVAYDVVNKKAVSHGLNLVQP